MPGCSAPCTKRLDVFARAIPIAAIQSFLLNVHVEPRHIYITRHGESDFNTKGTCLLACACECVCVCV